MQYTDELNMNGIKYPVKVKGITKLEKQNSPEVSVMKRIRFTYFVLSENIKTHHLILLYITKGESAHYLSKLVSCQYVRNLSERM